MATRDLLWTWSQQELLALPSLRLGPLENFYNKKLKRNKRRQSQVRRRAREVAAPVSWVTGESWATLLLRSQVTVTADRPGSGGRGPASGTGLLSTSALDPNVGSRPSLGRAGAH